MGEKLELPNIISPHNITFDACSEKKNHIVTLQEFKLSISTNTFFALSFFFKNWFQFQFHLLNFLLL
jgi:hypothetical protein